MRKKVLNIETRNKLILQSRYTEKKSLKDISLIFGISRQAVLKIIKKELASMETKD
jgi:DNA-directed RNA polymerase specialized sigma subunit